MSARQRQETEASERFERQKKLIANSQPPKDYLGTPRKAARSSSPPPKKAPKQVVYWAEFLDVAPAEHTGYNDYVDDSQKDDYGWVFILSEGDEPEDPMTIQATNAYEDFYKTFACANLEDGDVVDDYTVEVFRVEVNSQNGARTEVALTLNDETVFPDGEAANIKYKVTFSTSTDQNCDDNDTPLIKMRSKELTFTSAVAEDVEVDDTPPSRIASMGVTQWVTMDKPEPGDSSTGSAILKGESMSRSLTIHLTSGPDEDDEIHYEIMMNNNDPFFITTDCGSMMGAAIDSFGAELQVVNHVGSYVTATNKDFADVEQVSIMVRHTTTKKGCGQDNYGGVKLIIGLDYAVPKAMAGGVESSNGWTTFIKFESKPAANGQTAGTIQANQVQQVGSYSFQVIRGDDDAEPLQLRIENTKKFFNTKNCDRMTADRSAKEHYFDIIYYDGSGAAKKFTGEVADSDASYSKFDVAVTLNTVKDCGCDHSAYHGASLVAYHPGGVQGVRVKAPEGPKMRRKSAPLKTWVKMTLPAGDGEETQGIYTPTEASQTDFLSLDFKCHIKGKNIYVTASIDGSEPFLPSTDCDEDPMLITKAIKLSTVDASNGRSMAFTIDHPMFQSSNEFLLSVDLNTLKGNGCPEDTIETEHAGDVSKIIVVNRDTVSPVAAPRPAASASGGMDEAKPVEIYPDLVLPAVGETTSVVIPTTAGLVYPMTCVVTNNGVDEPIQLKVSLEDNMFWPSISCDWIVAHDDAAVDTMSTQLKYVEVSNSGAQSEEYFTPSHPIFAGGNTEFSSMIMYTSVITMGCFSYAEHLPEAREMVSLNTLSVKSRAKAMSANSRRAANTPAASTARDPVTLTIDLTLPSSAGESTTSSEYQGWKFTVTRGSDSAALKLKAERASGIKYFFSTRKCEWIEANPDQGRTEYEIPLMTNMGPGNKEVKVSPTSWLFTGPNAAVNKFKARVLVTTLTDAGCGIRSGGHSDSHIIAMRTKWVVPAR